MPRKDSPYNHQYAKERKALLGLPCEMRLACDGNPATSADHDPPLSRHIHVAGSGCCRLRPGCKPCQDRQKVLLAGQSAHFKALGVPTPLTDYQPSRSWL